jgi:hypothetical protein
MIDNKPNVNARVSHFEQFATWAFRFVIGITVLWLLLIVARVSGIQWTYETISDWLSQNLNLSDEISFGLAVILTAAALPFLELVTSYIFLGKHQVNVALLVIVAACIAIALQFSFGQDVFFLEDGTPMRCYAMTPDGIKVVRRKPPAECPRDKTYHIQYLPITQQIVPSVLAAKRGVEPVRIDLELFDGNYVGGANGRKLVWYYRKPNGTFELFNGAGFHPQTGQPLLPIDARVTNAIASDVEKAKQRRDEKQKLKADMAPQTTQQSRTQELHQILHVVPGGNFQKADVPGGVVIEKITADCLQGCIAQVEHDGFQICTTGHYQGADCASITVDTVNGVARHREQFVQLPGKKIDLPSDLRQVIFSFGTDEEFGPIQVNVKTVISR